MEADSLSSHGCCTRQRGDVGNGGAAARAVAWRQPCWAMEIKVRGNETPPLPGSLDMISCRGHFRLRHMKLSMLTHFECLFVQLMVL